MKLKIVLRILILFIIITILVSCSLFGTTQEERIARFVKDLNESRTYIYENFDSEIADYTDIQTALYTWDVWFPTGSTDSADYTITDVDTSADPITGIIAGPEEFGDPKQIGFTMVKTDAFNSIITMLYLDSTIIVE